MQLEEKCQVPQSRDHGQVRGSPMFSLANSDWVPRDDRHCSLEDLMKFLHLSGSAVSSFLVSLSSIVIRS